MKRKDRHNDFYLKVDEKVVEMDDYIEELNIKKKEVEDLRYWLIDIRKQYYLHPDDSKKKKNRALKKRLKKLFTEFNKTRESISLALGISRVGSSDAGGSNQEACDVKTGTERNQSSESSEVRTGIEGKGKDVVVPGGDSGESEEQKKQGDVKSKSVEEGGSTNTRDDLYRRLGIETRKDWIETRKDWIEARRWK